MAHILKETYNFKAAYLGVQTFKTGKRFNRPPNKTADKGRKERKDITKQNEHILISDYNFKAAYLGVSML